MTLDDMKLLCNKAQPGPWHYMHVPGCLQQEHVIQDRSGGQSLTICTNTYTGEIYANTMKFIAAARTMMPKLIAVAEAAKLAHQFEDSPARNAALMFDDAMFELGNSLADLESDT